jgi:AcrR family transcriptional regulator
MPRSEEQFEAMRAESREAILNSALHLFAERGYAATTIREIARDAAVSLGLLYNYFDGKEALLHAIFARSMVDVQASIDAAAGGATAHERIERLIAAAFRIVAEELPFWRLTYQLRMQSGVVEGLGESIRAWSDATRVQLEALLREAGRAQPDVEARLLFATIDGVAQHYALDPERYPLAAVARAIIARFLPPARSARKQPARKRRR